MEELKLLDRQHLPGIVGASSGNASRFQSFAGRSLTAPYVASTLRDVKRVQRTALFDRWLRRLRDDKAIQKITARLVRLEAGNPGDHKRIGKGLTEMRIDTGPGYRVYFTERRGTVILLLCGGDKASQRDDIAKARTMIEEL